MQGAGWKIKAGNVTYRFITYRKRSCWKFDEKWSVGMGKVSVLFLKADLE